MPDLQDKLSEPPFPSELNPLTNPALERNLGRWAQVYFSNPPAKRQQAVSKLLEEIQRETGAEPAEKAVRPYFSRDQKFQSALCSTCQHQNPPGHKFCSRCGQVLRPSQPGPADLGARPKLARRRPRGPRPMCSGCATGPLAVWTDLTVRKGEHGNICWARSCLCWPVSRICSGPRDPGQEWRHPVLSPQVSAPVASLPQDSSPAESNPPEAISAEPKTPEAQNSATTAAHDHAAVPDGLQPASQKSPLPGCPTIAAGAGRRRERRFRSAARPALSGRQHGRAGFLRSREVAVEGSQETKCHRSGPAVRPLFARGRRSPQLRSGAPSAYRRRQARSPAGGATAARSGIAGLSVKNPESIEKQKDPRAGEGLLFWCGFGFSVAGDCGVGRVDGD